MDKELMFGKALDEIRRKAASQGGFVDKNDIEDILNPLELDDEKIKMVYDYLKGRGIRWELKFSEDPVKVSGGPSDKASRDGYTASDEEAVLSEFALDETDVDFLKMYLDELADLEEISESEKMAVTMSAMAGDTLSKEKLINCYLKNIAELSRIYTGQGVLIEDLIGEGNTALVRAVNMLDSQEKPEDCEGFIIRLAMDSMEELVNEAVSEDKKAGRIAEKANKVYDKAMELAESMERRVTVKEVSEYSGLSEKTVREAMKLSGGAIECIEDNEE